MVLSYLTGDLLSAKENHIAQQCNCLTVRSHGLSAVIAKKYPWADVYASRKGIGNRNCAASPELPGTIKVMQNGYTAVICLFAQWAPGTSGSYSRSYPKTYNDTSSDRERWFAHCLTEVDKLQLPAVAVPYMIGCGLAGGNWLNYEAMLNAATTPFIVYKLPSA